MRNKNSNSLWIIIGVIILILLFLASLGSFSGKKINKLPKEFKDDKAEAIRKHQRLVEFIEKQKALKKRLAQKFKRIYFGVRLGLILLWLTIMATLAGLELINNVGEFLDYCQISVLIIVTINFLTFGSLSNYQDFIQMIKTRTENLVYGKYVSLDSKIQNNEQERKKLTNYIENK